MNVALTARSIAWAVVSVAFIACASRDDSGVLVDSSIGPDTSPNTDGGKGTSADACAGQSDSGVCSTTADCPPEAVGTWTECDGFDGICDASGSTTRTVTRWNCEAGACRRGTTTDSGDCTRAIETGCGEVTLYTLPDLLAQHEAGDEVIRAGSGAPAGQTSITLWQVGLSTHEALGDLTARTGLARGAGYARAASASESASAAVVTHEGVGLWIDTCAPGVRATSEIQPVVLGYDFAAPVPLFDGLHPELAMRLDLTMATAYRSGAAEIYLDAVMRLRETSASLDPLDLAGHDIWITFQVFDARGSYGDGVQFDSCAACSGLPIVTCDPGAGSPPSAFAHTADRSTSFVAAASSTVHHLDLRISAAEVGRMLTAVAVVDRTHVRSVDPADYALVHMNVNPEVYDPTLATGDCDDSTEPDVGRLGVAITRWTLSRVSWDRIPHVYFRGTNRSTGAALQIYFSRIDAPAFDEARSFGAAPFPGDGTGFEARFDVLAHPEWRGAITGLRLDPVDGAGCFEVEALELHLPDRPPAWRAPTDTAPAFPSPPWVISGLDPGTIAFRASTPSTAAAWHGCSVGGDPWLALSGLSISAP